MRIGALKRPKHFGFTTLRANRLLMTPIAILGWCSIKVSCVLPVSRWIMAPTTSGSTSPKYTLSSQSIWKMTTPSTFLRESAISRSSWGSLSWFEQKIWTTSEEKLGERGFQIWEKGFEIWGKFQISNLRRRREEPYLRRRSSVWVAPPDLASVSIRR